MISVVVRRDGEILIVFVTPLLRCACCPSTLPAQLVLRASSFQDLRHLVERRQCEVRTREQRRISLGALQVQIGFSQRHSTRGPRQPGPSVHGGQTLPGRIRPCGSTTFQLALRHAARTFALNASISDVCADSSSSLSSARRRPRAMRRRRRAARRPTAARAGGSYRLGCLAARSLTSEVTRVVHSSSSFESL